MKNQRVTQEQLIAWGTKWTAIRDNAATPATRAYAEAYLDMLRRQLRAELAALTEARP